MDTPLKVWRQRPGRSLYSKILIYGEIFNMNITIIAQERVSGDHDVFQPGRDENRPSARPDILHTGRPTKSKGWQGRRQTKLGQMEILLRQHKVPKPRLSAE
ncbi:hypothetical protein F4779DRAFT_620550 [Xylariaceae sp. FL0662B]|nr:hypothetical protein F4779DRAFT_620550 [Xylariaceae sp. FL0662B]